MRRVTWPTRQAGARRPLVVVIDGFAFAAYFCVVDIIVGGTVGKFINVFKQ